MAENKSGLYLPLYIDMQEWEQQLLYVKNETAKTLKEISGAASKMTFKYQFEASGAELMGDAIKAATLNIDTLQSKVDLYRRSIEVINKALEEERVELAKTGQAESKRSKQLEAALYKNTNDLAKFTGQLQKASQKSFTLTNTLTKYDSDIINKTAARETSRATLNSDEVGKTRIEYERLTSQIKLYSDAIKEVSGAYVQEVSANGTASKSAALLRSTMDDLIIKVNTYKKELAEVNNLQAQFTAKQVSMAQKQYGLEASSAELSGDDYAKRAAKLKELRSIIAIYKADLERANKALEKEIALNGQSSLGASILKDQIVESTTALNRYNAELAKEVANFDAIAQKQLSDIDRKYNLAKSQATLAGDDTKQRELAISAINERISVYETKLKSLRTALEQEVKANGEASASVVNLRNAIMETETAMNQEKAQIETLTGSIKSFASEALDRVFVRIGRFSVSISQLSQWFAPLGKAIDNVKGRFNGLIDTAGDFVTSHSADLAKWAAAYGPVVAAVGGVIAVAKSLYGVLEQANEAMRDMSRQGMEAAKSLLAFRSRFELDDATAGRWADIAAIAGSEVNTLAFAVGEVTIAIDKQTGAGKRAQHALEVYGESARKASGELKNFDEFMASVAEGYQKAVANGEGNRYLKDIFGRQWVTIQQLIPAMEKYADIQKQIGDFQDGNLDKIRAAQMAVIASGTALDANKRLWSEIYSETEEYFNALKIEQYKAINDFLKENKDDLKGMLQSVREILGVFTRLVTAAINFGKNLKEYKDVLLLAPGSTGVGIVVQAYEKISDILGRNVGLKAKQTALDKEIANLIKEQADSEEKASLEASARFLEIEKAQGKLQELYQPLDKVIRQSGMSDMEKELDNIATKYDALVEKAKSLEHENNGITVDFEKIEIARGKEIEAIREKYIYAPERKEAERQQQELEKQAKDAVKKYEEQVKAAQNANEQISQVFMSESERRIYAINKEKDAWIKAGADEVAATQAAQKKIREARMSEAERTIRENAALLKKMRRLQESGDPNYQENAMAWADRRYMRGIGIKNRDLDFASMIGIDRLREIGSSASRVFSRFAGDSSGATIQNQNTVNVNFDNTVVENEAALTNLANKVAELIVPHVEKAVGAPSGSNSYAGAMT